MIKLEKTIILNGDYLKHVISLDATSLREKVQILLDRISNEPNDVISHNELGILYHSLGKYKNAIDEYDASLQINAEQVQVNYYRGETYRELRKYKEAIEAYTKELILKSDNYLAKKGLGISYHLLENYKEALEEYSSSLLINPQQFQVIFNMGEAYRELGNYSKAIEAYEKALILKTNDFLTHSNLSIAYAKADLEDKAISEYKIALNTKKEYIDFLCNSGMALIELRRHSDAINVFTEALKFDADNTEILYILGLAQEMGGHFHDAIKLLNRVNDLNPKHPELYSSLGRIFMTQGYYDKAINAYKKEISLNNTNFHARYDLGRLYIATNNKMAAINECKLLKLLNLDLSQKLRDTINTIFKSAIFDYDYSAFLINRPIHVLGFSLDTLFCLLKGGVCSIGDLASISKDNLLSIDEMNIGKYKEVRKVLIDNGLDIELFAKSMSCRDGLHTDILSGYLDIFPFFSNSSMTDLKQYYKRLDIPIDILEANFPVRAINAFESFGICSLLDLLFVSGNNFCRRRNVGRKTYREVCSILRMCLNKPDLMNLILDCNKNGGISSNRVSLDKFDFPFFNNSPPSIDTDNHFKNLDVPIYATGILFSVRAKHSFEKLNIRTLLDLLNISKDVFCNTRNVGRGTYTEIRDSLFEHLSKYHDLLAFNNKENVEPSFYLADEYDISTNHLIENHESLSVFIGSLEACILEKEMTWEYVLKSSKTTKLKRQLVVLKMRLGIGCDKSTLEEVGQAIGTTRERARQIENKVIKYIYDNISSSCKIFIKRFLKNIDDNSGMFCGDLNDKLLSSRGLKIFNAFIIYFNKNIEYIPDICVWKYKDNPKYNNIVNYITKHLIIGASFDECELDEYISNSCRAVRIEMESYESIIRLIKKDKFQIHNRRYYFKYVNKLLIVEELIKIHFPNGLAIYKDFGEFLEVVCNANYDFLQNMSKTRLRGYIERIDGIILWDWGFYIHMDNIDVDDKVLEMVDLWLSNKLSQDNIPRVSLWGAFNQHEKDCRDSGILNEHALYSLMKMKYMDKYSFLKDPHVYRKSCDDRIDGRELVIKYCLNMGCPTSQDDIMEALGLKSYQLQNILSSADEIMTWGSKSVVHVDNINIEPDILDTLHSYLKIQLDKYSHISVKSVYDDNIVTCKKNSISSPRALYSILSYNYGDTLCFPVYPHILIAEHGINDDGRLSLNDLVNHYFASRNKIVSSDELHDYFVIQRGYNATRINDIQYLCDSIVRYTRGSYVSLDTLCWTDEKSKNLEDKANDIFRNKCTFTLPFAFVDDLLAEHLPCINEIEDISWQRTLLKELLDKIDSIRLLGNTRDIYVVIPNKHNIEDTDDLITFILRNEYHGAANKDVFIKRLKELSIAGSLKSIDYNKAKIKISNEEIFIV